jgi:hypothetical protein
MALQALLPDLSSLATVNNIAGQAASVGSGGTGSSDGIYHLPTAGAVSDHAHIGDRGVRGGGGDAILSEPVTAHEARRRAGTRFARHQLPECGSR